MKKESNMDYWEKTLSVMPESYKMWFDLEKKYLQKNIKKNSSVLEIGCGDGRSLNYIINLASKIVGIDIDEKAINDAESNLDGIDFRVADGKNLPFKDSSFDYIICMTTPANFGDDKDKFYSEMKRVVKYDGEIILSVFNEDALEERMKSYKTIGLKIKSVEKGKIIFSDSCDVGVSEQFSKIELEEIFERNSLKIIEIKKEGIGYFCRLKK